MELIVRRPIPAWKAILVLAALSAALKLFLVLCPSRHVSPGWVYVEELHRGNVAREINTGPLLQLQDYQFAPIDGGSLVTSLMTAPLVRWFGSSIFVVRLVPILFDALAVAMAFLILDRFARRRAAWIGATLLALAPPGYQLLAITACSTHTENNALTLVAVYLFLCLHENGHAEAEPAGERRLALLFGVVAGFSLYFGYMVSIALAAMLVFEFLHDKLFLLRRWFRCALVGFAVGFSPWVLYNATRGFRGAEVYGVSIWTRLTQSQTGLSPLDRLELLARDYLPSSYFFAGFSEPARAGSQFSLLAVVSLLVVAALWIRRREIVSAARALVSLRERPRDLGLEMLLLLYVPIFAIGFALFDAGQGSIARGIAADGRYAAPLTMVLALLAGAVLARGSRGFARLATGSIAGLCLIGTIAVADTARAGEALSKPGASEAEFARWVAWTWRTDVSRIERIVKRCEANRSSKETDGLVFALAQGLKWGLATVDPRDPTCKENRKRHLAALDFLRQRVADPFKPYCEPLRPGEPIYAYRQRDEFWSNYRLRDRAAFSRAVLALPTPGS